MISWGISGNSHDAAIAVFDKNSLLFASQTERFSGIKNDPDIPANMVNYLEKQYGKPKQIFWYEKPISKSLRQLWAGQGWLFEENNIWRWLNERGISADITYTDHHLSHAAAAYYTSCFRECVVLVVDSIGEWDTVSIWKAKDLELKKVYSRTYPNSLGLFYSAMTQRVGLKPQEDEYILMGMAAYGDPHRLKDQMYTDMFSADGVSKNLHRGYKNWLTKLNSQQDLFDIAAATQWIYEREFEKLLKIAKTYTNTNNIALAGGCVLNCVANPLAYRHFNGVWIFPNPGDSGSAIGAVLAHKKKNIRWTDCFWGYNIGGNYPVHKCLLDLMTTGIVGVANGRAEFGPRALGNRSLLADPRTLEMKEKVNTIKQRQQFRPFAPVVLEEFADDYFELDGNVSRYMQYAVKCKKIAEIPAAVHVDGTCRVQTIPPNNHGLRLLLEEWYELTGCPVLLNTSLNIKGQPIVNDLSGARSFEQLYDVNVHTYEK
jgi:carbamoyltransferase